MTIPAHEITIPDPKEQPMVLALVEVARIMARAAHNMYNQRYESLLLMWKSAKEIRKDLHAFARRVQGVLNFGLDASPKTGEVGVCQIILQLCKKIQISLSTFLLQCLTTLVNSVSHYFTTHIPSLPRL